jgi:hypothetical protein
MEFSPKSTGRQAKIFEAGQVVSFLRVLEFVGRSPDNGELLYKVECLRPQENGEPCGNTKIVRGQVLRSNANKVLSCGCFYARKLKEWEAKRNASLVDGSQESPDNNEQEAKGNKASQPKRGRQARREPLEGTKNYPRVLINIYNSYIYSVGASKDGH